jgi:TldD protein
LDESPLQLDLERVFQALRALGADDIELYAESRTTHQLDIWDRVHHGRSLQDRGLSIYCRKGETSFHFCSNLWDTESVLKLIAGKPLKDDAVSAAIPPVKVAATKPGSAPLLAPHCVTVLHVARAAFAPAASCGLWFEEEICNFWVTRESAGWTAGSRKSVRTQARWKIEQEGAPSRTYEWERSGLDPDAFVDGLKNEFWLSEAVKKSAGRLSTWPAPTGELPVFWSSQALAKIALPFVRAFEADLFLKDQSLLQKLSFPARWGFTLTDMPQTAQPGVDAEGNTVAQLVVLKNGKPRGLACNRRTAGEMQVPETGHSRRQNFRHLPVPAFWNVALHWSETEPDLLARCQSGIWVEDVEVLESDPASGLICLATRKAFLMHEKTLGEPIENVVFEMEVHDFLANIEGAGEKQKTFGFEIQKEGQRLTTQIQLPDVFTPAFPFPGSVPSDTYW